MSDPGPSRSFLLHPPPPSQNQTPGLSTWFRFSPSWTPLHAHRQYPQQRHFQPVLVTLGVMGTERPLKASLAFSLKGRSCHTLSSSLLTLSEPSSVPYGRRPAPRQRASPLWAVPQRETGPIPLIECCPPPMIPHGAPASWLNPTLRLG